MQRVLDLITKGSLIRAEFANGHISEYNKIKNTRDYIARLKKNTSLVKVYIDNELQWTKLKM